MPAGNASGGLTQRGRRLDGRVLREMQDGKRAAPGDRTASTLAEYEALILTLATEPDVLGALTAKLKARRPACPLFDTDRFRRHMGAWEFWQAGAPPQAIDVES